MKKFKFGIVLIFSVVMMMFTACGSGSESTTAGTSEPATDTTKETEDPGASEGGWVGSYTIVTQLLTDESKIAFNAAMKEYAKENPGAELEPASLLAVQLVAGKNYTYVVKGENVTPGVKEGWYIVVVYQDLRGNAKVTHLNEINLSNLHTVTEVTAPMGSWAIEQAGSDQALPEDVQSDFDKAEKNQYDDISFQALALLGTRTNDGTDYMILCKGTIYQENPVNALYFVTLSVDTEGNAVITDAGLVNIIEYIE